MQDLVDEDDKQVFVWPTKSRPTASAPVDGVLTCADGKDEAFLSLQLSCPEKAVVAKPHTLLIAVVDKSGSMSSYWKPQVLPALNSLAQIAWNQEQDMTTEIITYSSAISKISLKSRAQFQSDLNETRASGGTHFAKAFIEIKDTLSSMLPRLREKYKSNIQIVIAFMTDGQDSQGKTFAGLPFWTNACEDLKSFLRTSPLTEDIISVLHALAFGSSHDFQLLDGLRSSVGTIEGGFQYAEPGDGAAALKVKLDAIVNSVANPTVQSKIRIEIPHYLVNTGTCLQESWTNDAIPLPELVTYHPSSEGISKTILNLVVRRDPKFAFKSATSETSTSEPKSEQMETKQENQAPTESEPVSSSAATSTPSVSYDYYGQPMPSFNFPQPGMSYANDMYGAPPSGTVPDLYSYDPYSFNFGPQPGMSHSFDFGPQPGMSSYSSYDNQVSSSTSSSEPLSSTDTSTTALPVAPADLIEIEAPVDGSKITVKVYQVRMDNQEVGEVASELTVRVDTLSNTADVFNLGIEQMAHAVSKLEREVAVIAIKTEVPEQTFKNYTNMVNKLERQLNDTSKIMISMTKSQRAALQAHTASLRESFTRIHSTLAQASKGGMSTAQLARMAEFAHGQQFSKARRARAMDSRAHQNAAAISKEENELANTLIDTNQLDHLMDSVGFEESQKLINEWYCVLTQDNWYNMLIDEKDCIGFGVALRRPETVVDDPHQIRVLDISLTCVAKSAFEHVLSHKLMNAQKDSRDPIQARLAYLGGFNVEGKDLGVVVRGTANEPINAWLPLFITPEHWRLAMIQMKSITGFLVTLDPLGFAFNQLDVYFLILATMIVRMKVASNRQVEMVVQYLRTCIALMNDFPGLKKKMTSTIQGFIEDPALRLKDTISSLLVLLGYLVCMPTNDLSKLLPDEASWTRLWVDLFTELTRRALDTCSRIGRLGSAAVTLFQNLVSRLVDGYLNETPLTEEELRAAFNPEEALKPPPNPWPKQRTFKSFSQGPSQTQKDEEEKSRLAQAPILNLELKKDNENTGMWAAFWEAAEKDLKESFHPMEWESLRDTDDFRVMPATKTKSFDGKSESMAASGFSLVNESVTKTSLAIPTSAYQDLSHLYGSAYINSASNQDKKSEAQSKKESRVDTEEIKNRAFHPDACLPKSMEAIHLCENVVSNYGQPTVEGLINMMTFMKSWTNLCDMLGGTNRALQELDSNLGVAPISWLIHFRDDWQRRPHVRNSFFTFLNFVDVFQIPQVRSQLLGTPEVLQLRMLRAILAQNAKFSANKDARAALLIRRNDSADSWRDPTLFSEEILTSYHRERVQRLIATASAQAASDASESALLAMLKTSTIYEFIGYLMCTGDGLGANRYTWMMGKLYRLLQTPLAPSYPLAVLKMSILLTGKYVDPNTGIVVQLLSHQWVPGKKHLARFQRAWGAQWRQVLELCNLTFIRGTNQKTTTETDDE